MSFPCKSFDYHVSLVKSNGNVAFQPVGLKSLQIVVLSIELANVVSGVSNMSILQSASLKSMPNYVEFLCLVDVAY